MFKTLATHGIKILFTKKETHTLVRQNTTMLDL